MHPFSRRLATGFLVAGFQVAGLLVAGFLSLSVPASAQVLAGPTSVNVQGRLTRADGAALPDGVHTLTLSLWDAASGGSQKFSQTLSGVQVTGGLFSTQITTLTPGVLNGSLWVQAQVDGDPPMTPRQPFTSAASALKANTVPDGAIGSVQLATDNASLGKVSGGALTNVSGNIGVGNTFPFARLDIQGGADNTGANDKYDIALSYRNGGYRHWIRSRHNAGADNGNAIEFFVNTSSTSGGSSAPGIGNVQVLTLGGSGNVGVGTSDPKERLSLNGRLSFVQKAGDQADSAKLDYRNFDGNSLSIVGAGTTDTNRNVRVFDTLSVGYSAPTGGVAAFNGNVGIGTSSPSAPLHISTAAGFPASGLVSSSSVSGTWLQLANTSAGGRGWSLVSTGSGNGEGAGNLLWYDHGGTGPRMILTSTGNVGIDTMSPSSELDVNGEVTARVVTVTGGSDVAEPYDVAPQGAVAPQPGMVVSIEKGGVGRMQVSGHAYDKCVAGILSGANGVAPGITLRHKGTVADGALPVASIGRVWCWCDADAGGPIEEGDLLTSSDTPGHAMKVTDHARADGAVIGKAMSSLASGKGLVLVLVSLK